MGGRIELGSIFLPIRFLLVKNTLGVKPEKFLSTPMLVRIYVCMHICFVCMYVCIHVCLYPCICICIHACISVFISVYAAFERLYSAKQRFRSALAKVSVVHIVFRRL